MARNYISIAKVGRFSYASAVQVYFFDGCCFILYGMGTVVSGQMNVSMDSFLTYRMSTFFGSHTLICSFQAIDNIYSARDHSRVTGP
jgi:hypothetical protein